MKKILITAFVISTIIMPMANADKHKSRTFKTTQIRSGLTLLQGKGGNIAVSSGDDGILIIDDDYAEMSTALKEAINKLGGVDKLKFIINTHWHGDHTEGNISFGKNTNIIAHNNVRKRLSSPQEIPLFKMVSKPLPPHALPNLTYPQSMVIHFNNDTLTLKHYPNGHTDGDTVIFFEKANTVHMGDLLFFPMFPFVDRANGGNAISYADNIGRIIKKIDDNCIVIPGHGPLTDKKGLMSFHQMLTGTIAEVSAMKSTGLSLEKAQSKGLSKQWESWGGGFIKEPTWISFIYKSL